jgi:Tfp pilus assembly protein PilZ
MEYRSDLARSAGSAAPGPQRRRIRQKVRTLAYVNLDHDNGGILRDLSEAGIAIQAVSPLRTDQQVHLCFELLDPRVRIETGGRVAWSDPVGQAGVEFLDTPPRARRLLKEWIFTQLLAKAYRTAWDSIFIHRKPDEEAAELLFSQAPRPAIRLAEAATQPQPQEDTFEGRKSKTRVGPPEVLRLPWCPIPISPEGLAGFVDSLIVLSALLLFSVVSMAMTHDLPAWPLTAIFVFGAAITFATLYWFLFAVWVGTTPGRQLARLACDSEDGWYMEEDERFR